MQVPMYPATSINGRKQTLMKENWLPLFDKYKVTMVLEHYEDVYKRSKGLRSDNIVTAGYDVPTKASEVVPSCSSSLFSLDVSNSTFYVGGGAMGVPPVSSDKLFSTDYLSKVCLTQHYLEIHIQKRKVNGVAKTTVDGLIFDNFTLHY
eukprot:TRINITY_DN6271_c0_g1_i1.p1 TRINITY_DN6271_c0_g1~~TRINITY_DN6271_c0_g1_i1.p1  ORF type:complete len:149 (+),score=29.88 TRINITY_DN6271_c0_g1_i1:112-558(+)